MDITIGNRQGLELGREKKGPWSGRMMKGQQKKKFSKVESHVFFRPGKIPSFSFLPQVLPADTQNLGDLFVGMIALQDLDGLPGIFFNGDKVPGIPRVICFSQQLWWELFRSYGIPFVGEV